MAEPGRPNAGILYSSVGYSTQGETIFGINVASEGILQALARHGTLDHLYGVVDGELNANAFIETIAAVRPNMVAQAISILDTPRLAELGTLLLPGPGLARYGWMRRSMGRRAYSLCGITHTTATPVVLDTIADWPTAPVYPWDAVICTSVAVRRMVQTVLADQSVYLADRLGVADLSFSVPELPVIPLGVECDDFVADPAARARWRDELKIADGDVVGLFVGRLSFHAKAHPLPLFQAIEKAARAVGPKLHLVLAGWFGSEPIEQAYKQAADQICPAVTVHFLDGREPSIRRSIWHAADFFVAPIDNIQETFGLAVIEAMAAGLPVIASDWDGLRDSIRDGVDGYLIPTIAIPPGVCSDLSMRLMAELDDREYFIGQASQAVVIDATRFADAIAALASSAETRREMGESARRRARAEFDWRHVVGKYQALWEELRIRRVAERSAGPESPIYPARPDPFHAFESYPSRLASPQLTVTRTARPDAALDEYFDSPMVTFAHRALPTRVELAALLASLSASPRTIGDLLDAASIDRRRALWRGIVWLAKYDFVRLS